METTNNLTMQNLIENVKEQTLIDYILKLNSSYSVANAKNFINYLKVGEHEKRCNEEYKKYSSFVSVYLASQVANYNKWDLEDINRKALENYKSHMESTAKEDEEQKRKDFQKSNFITALTGFYLGRDTEEETTKALAGENKGSRYFEHNEALKTLEKIKKKMQTKSHNFDKISKLIDEDIERGYQRRVPLTEEQEKTLQKVGRSAGFINRR